MLRFVQSIKWHAIVTTDFPAAPQHTDVKKRASATTIENANNEQEEEYSGESSRLGCAPVPVKERVFSRKSPVLSCPFTPEVRSLFVAASEL